MQLKLSLTMPPPQPANQDKIAATGLSVEDKVKKAIELVDSGYCSDVEWLMLNKLYQSLKSKKQNDRVKNLISMIKPVLAKYGYHDVATNDKGTK